MTDNEQDVLDYMDLSDTPDGPPVIPAGEYHMKVVDAESRSTKEGDGRFINYRAVVQSGDFAGRSVFGFWTTKNAANKQENTWRTKRDWKLLGYAPAGAPRISEIVGLEGYAKVGLREKDDGGSENNIKTWIRAI